MFSLTSCLVDTQSGMPTTAPFTLSSDVFENYATETVSNLGEGSATLIYHSDSYDSAKLRDFFLDTALNGAPNGGQYICRWAQHIDYYIKGKVPDAEREYMEGIFLALNGISNFPGITQTDIEADADLIIYYTSLNELHRIFETKDTVHTDESSNEVVERTTSAGYFVVDTSTSEIYKAEIGISLDDTTSEQRCAQFSKELIKICGLPFKSARYSESILYSGGVTAHEPAEVDYMALDILYNEKLRCGSSFSEAFITVINLLTK